MFTKKKKEVVAEEVASAVDRRQYIELREKREEEERQRKIEEERLRQEEEARKQKEEQERLERERLEKERLKKEEEERQRKLEEERIKREEELKQQEERQRKMEEERIRIEQERKQEEERQKKLEEEKLRKEEEERQLKLQEEEKLRKEKEEAERQRLIAEQERLQYEKEQRQLEEQRKYEEEQKRQEEYQKQLAEQKEQESVQTSMAINENEGTPQGQLNNYGNMGIPNHPKELQQEKQNSEFNKDDLEKPSAFKQFLQAQREQRGETENKYINQLENNDYQENNQIQWVENDDEVNNDPYDNHVEINEDEQVQNEDNQSQGDMTLFEPEEKPNTQPNNLNFRHDNDKYSNKSDDKEVIDLFDPPNIAYSLDEQFESLPFADLKLQNDKFNPSKVKVGNDKFQKNGVDILNVFDKIGSFEAKYNITSDELNKYKKNIQEEDLNEWKVLLASKQLVDKEVEELKFSHQIINGVYFAPLLKEDIPCPAYLGDKKNMGKLTSQSDVKYKVGHSNKEVYVEIDSIFSFDSLIDVEDNDGQWVLSNTALNKVIVEELLIYLNVHNFKNYLTNVDWATFVYDELHYDTKKLSNNKLHIKYRFFIDKNIGLHNIVKELKLWNNSFKKLSKSKKIDNYSKLAITPTYKRIMRKKSEVENIKQDLMLYLSKNNITDSDRAWSILNDLSKRDVSLLHQELLTLHSKEIKHIFPFKFNGIRYNSLKDMFEQRVMFISDRHKMKDNYTLAELSYLYKDLKSLTK